MLGLDPAESVPDRETLYFSIRGFLEAVAAEHPIVLVFEDLHWGDPSLLDLVEMLSARLRDVPILVLVLARPELLDARPSWGGGLPSYTALPLQPLSQDEARELAQQLLEQLELDDREQRAALFAATAEGNPLFIEQLAAASREVLGRARRACRRRSAGSSRRAWTLCRRLSERCWSMPPCRARCSGRAASSASPTSATACPSCSRTSSAAT